MAFETTVDGPRRRRDDEDEGDEPRLSLVLIWAVAPEDQERLGEVIFPDDGAVFGRGVDQDDESRVGLFRQVPSKNARAAPIEANFLSRRQLKFSVESDAIGVEALGKRGLRVNDAKTETRQATLREGDVFEIDGLYAFYCARRPLFLEDGTFDPAHRFGRVDDHGIVGESPAAWSLRTTIAFVGKRNAHVLITGSSGTGKELIAQAIHRLSSRAKKELVARNAATFPSGLIDAELFGNVQNYPNVGMPERPGLIGQAHDSTLFLDEIGELPIDMQAHLLRVLDNGEYQRLGDARKRTSDFRLIAATNRSASELKEDVLARLGIRVHSPGLDERREDIPLLARHLLRRMAAKDAPLRERFFEGSEKGDNDYPRISMELTRALVHHEYATHVRELESLLLLSVGTSRGSELKLTKDVEKILRPMATAPVVATRSPTSITADEVRAALAKHAGVKDKVWRDLGLPSRHALHRLMKKMNIDE